jgi:Enoyl-CoA hydratase/carnithine racemase
MTTNDILFEEGPLAIITLNRPQALNALSYDMFLPMQEHLIKWQSDDSVKVLVLIKSNFEKAFCAVGIFARYMKINTKHPMS